MAREILPNRRRNETTIIHYRGQEVSVCVGFYDDGRPGEVFAAMHKTGTEMQHLLDDVCVIISLALQFGVTPVELVKSLGRLPAPEIGEDADKPASVLGAILDVVAETGGSHG